LPISDGDIVAQAAAKSDVMTTVQPELFALQLLDYLSEGSHILVGFFLLFGHVSSKPKSHHPDAPPVDGISGFIFLVQE
jgi:hypothetical protein